MADSKRTQILKVVDARLKTILVSGGYKTNLGQTVFDWKITSWASEDVPGMTYRDISNTKEGSGSVNKFRWQLMVEIEIIAQTTAPTMREMISDVLRAVGRDMTWNALAQRTNQPDTEMQAEQADKIITGAKITLPIIYDAPLWED
jgi:hypothetical protein